MFLVPKNACKGAGLLPGLPPLTPGHAALTGRNEAGQVWPVRCGGPRGGTTEEGGAGYPH